MSDMEIYHQRGTCWLESMGVMQLFPQGFHD